MLTVVLVVLAVLLGCTAVVLVLCALAPRQDTATGAISRLDRLDGLRDSDPPGTPTEAARPGDRVA